MEIDLSMKLRPPPKSMLEQLVEAALSLSQLSQLLFCCGNFVGNIEIIAQISLGLRLLSN